MILSYHFVRRPTILSETFCPLPFCPIEPIIRFMLRFAISFDLISRDLVSLDRISFDLISRDLVSLDRISFDLISRDLVSLDRISFDIRVYNYARI